MSSRDYRPSEPQDLYVFERAALGAYLRQNYSRAGELATKAVKAAYVHFGSKSPEAIRTMSNLGLSLVLTSRPRAALTVYKLVLEATNRQGPAAARAMNNIATLFLARGAYRMVQPLLDETVRATQSEYGPEDTRAIAARQNMSLSLAYQGKFDEAEAIIAGENPGARTARAVLNNKAHRSILAGDYGAVEALAREAGGITPDVDPNDGSVIWASVVIGEDDGGAPVDCSDFNGGNGPFDPVVTEHSIDWAHCGPFGTRPRYGLIVDWDGPGGPQPPGGGSGPGGGNGPGGGRGGGEPDPDDLPPEPDLPEPDDEPETCDDCFRIYELLVYECIAISIDPGPPERLMRLTETTTKPLPIPWPPATTLLDRCFDWADAWYSDCKQKVAEDCSSDGIPDLP